MKEHISGYAFTDEQTRTAMQQVFQQHGYIMDPHGAVGYLAWKAYQQEKSSRATGVILETAHPSKFREAVESILGSTVEIPDTLARLSARKKEAVQMPVNYIQFREWLINH